ncbi:MAG: 6-carboxytetrahydropterin synthase QueD [Deltaproteobacteria bacterium]|nr:6-carboxytetrahydropterin synthase QueD [Deltaproteobacteria bacterium]
MYEVAITKDFSAAHSLMEIGGGCETLHGHNFTVEVTVASDDLDPSGVVVDFRLLKRWTEEVLEGLDHKYLNELPYFAGRNPSSENLARYIHDRLLEKKIPEGFHIIKVTVWESSSSRASYLPEPSTVPH